MKMNYVYFFGNPDTSILMLSLAFGGGSIESSGTAVKKAPVTGLY